MSKHFTATLDLGFEEAVTKVREVLAQNGFGIITEVDVKAILKKKLDLDFKNYVILGACNPKLAHQAIQKNDNVGLLLPCNVLIYESAEGVIVSSMKPTPFLAILEDESLTPIAEEAEKLFSKVFKTLNT